MASRPPCKMIIMPSVSIRDTIRRRLMHTPLMKPIAVAARMPTATHTKVGRPEWVSTRAPMQDEIPRLPAIDRSISPTSNGREAASASSPSTVAWVRMFWKFAVDQKKSLSDPKITTRPINQTQTMFLRKNCPFKRDRRRGGDPSASAVGAD